MAQKQEQTPLVWLLLAAQCDEAFVVSCICQMRHRSIGVLLVGLYPGPVTGAHGIWLSPDQSLADVATTNGPGAACLLILPGPDECTMQLLLNPRVHELIEMTFANGGCVAAVSAKIQNLLVRSGLTTPVAKQCFLFQNQLNSGEFIDVLVRQTELLSSEMPF
ncbi:MAG: DJ-1/PfpI family protein [Anaerolineaceae bacterium]|nr:DJ-1/PfpI family protein [Anaerolineaceae bacterium]